MQTQNDYLRDWQKCKSTQYLQRIMRNQGDSGAQTCTFCQGFGSWKCLDCIGHPVRCTRCCRDHHSRLVFHRVQHWNGTFFEAASLYQAGVALHFGHGGLPCPDRSNACSWDASGAGAQRPEHQPSGEQSNDEGENQYPFPQLYERISLFSMSARSSRRRPVI